MQSPFANTSKGHFWALAFVPLSVLIHLLGLLLLVPRPVLKVQNKPVEIEFIQLPPPPKEIEPAVEEPPPEPQPIPPKPPPPKPPAAKPPPPKPPPPNPAPPPPHEETAQVEPPPPLLAGVSPGSTTESGSFSAPIGNTGHGSMQGPAPNPAEVKPYKADPYAHYASAHEVDKQPEVRSKFEIEYPEEARKAGIEAAITLRLWIDEHGKVQRVEALQKVGYGLDEAAKKAIMRYQFHPARKGGKPLPSNILYTFTFYLD
ncbi:MAG: TonB family protein [Cystobacterineae bacterium]|nr:TonB family protein [Cystobacterineae bacterium]